MRGGGSERRPRNYEKPAKPKVALKEHGLKSQLELVVEEQFHEPDAVDETCPDCGGHLEAWKGRSEESGLNNWTTAATSGTPLLSRNPRGNHLQLHEIC